MNKNLDKSVLVDLRSLANPAKAKILARFFKTGKGEYGEGDLFLGVMVPQQRMVAKKYYNDISFFDLSKLLKNKYHEVRLTAILILVEKYQKANDLERLEIYNFYWQHVDYINNWDLVDLSAPKIVGGFLLDNKKSLFILKNWSNSKNIWIRRIAVLSTFTFIRQKRSKEILSLAKILLKDKHDLIQKAVGWMLRELGKTLGEKILLDFLDQNAKQMPRVMLRYSLEKLSDKQRKFYLSLK